MLVRRMEPNIFLAGTIVGGRPDPWGGQQPSASIRGRILGPAEKQGRLQPTRPTLLNTLRCCAITVKAPSTTTILKVTTGGSMRFRQEFCRRRCSFYRNGTPTEEKKPGYIKSCSLRSMV